MVTTATILPKRVGAIGPYVYRLAKELARESYVDVIGFGSGKEETKNFCIQTIEFNRQIFAGSKLTGYTLSNIQLFKKISCLHKVFPIDILHIHDPYLGFMATLCKFNFHIPTICTIHNEMKTALFIRACDKILAVSEYIRKIFYEKLKISLDKVDVLSVAVDTDVHKPIIGMEEAKRELGLCGRDIVLFVGRKCYEKGPQVLIEALPEIVKHNPKALAVLIGPDYHFRSSSSTYTEFLRDRVKKLKVGDHVVLKGFVPEDVLRCYHNAADVFVCPSVWQEPLGLVILEALAHEKPVVATNVGGIPEIISNLYNGLLVPPNNSKELANAIILLLNDDELRRRLGRNGRKVVERKFSFEVICRQCLNIYDQIISKKLMHTHMSEAFKKVVP